MAHIVARAQDLLARFRDVWGTAGLFSPGEPLVPPAPEKTRVWDFPVGWNYIYTPRSYEATSFAQLRSLAENHDITRLVIETRKDQIEQLSWSIRARDANDPAADAPERIARVSAFWHHPDGEQPFGSWLREALEDLLVIDAPSFEVRRNRGGDVIGLDVVDGACYSSDMEVLTFRGWINFSDIDIDHDLFATRNIETKEFEWQKATYFHQVDYDGPMYHFHARALDLLVSPNHRMLISSLPRPLGGSRHRQSGETVVTAEQLAAHHSKRTAIPVTSVWRGREVADQSFARYHRSDLKMSGDDYCAFMGAWLAEGSRTADGASITQTPCGRAFAAYHELLTRIWGRPPCHTGSNFMVSSVALRRHLDQFGKARDKFIPEVIRDATPRQLAIFWRYFALGDGAADRDRIFTSSPRLADQLVEIAQKMGASASVRTREPAEKTMPDGRIIKAENQATSFVVSVRRTKAMQIGAVEIVPYRGKIACVSVPNEFLYVRRNGKPAWCGNTIKVLIDETGRRPKPPTPAFEQVIHGRPWRLLTADELIYAPRNRRPFKAYGCSPVEQIETTINIGLRRQAMQLHHFTEGNVPIGLLSSPANWTTEQIRQYQQWFDGILAGNTAERAKLIWGPAGTTYQSFKEAPFKDDFDEWLARIVCFAFSISPNAFIRQVQRTTADTLQEAALKEGLEPLKKWVKHLADSVIQTRMGHKDLEFAWDEEEALDPQNQSVILDRGLRNGLYSLNEARALMGFDPVAGGEEPRIYLPGGAVPVAETGSRTGSPG